MVGDLDDDVLRANLVELIPRLLDLD